jgi:hypothetical protein
MATNIHNSSGIARHIAASSLASMNLGALSLRQFGETVNWSNSTSYQPQGRTPWACLSVGDLESKAAVGSHESPTEVISTQAVEIETTIGEAEAISASKAAEDTAALAEAARIATKEAKAKSDAEDAEARLVAAKTEQAMAQELAAKEAAEKQVSVKQVAEQERLEQERKAAEFSLAQAKAQAEKEAAEQRAAKEAAESAEAARLAKVARAAEDTHAVADAPQTGATSATQLTATMEKANQEQLESQPLRSSFPAVRIPTDVPAKAATVRTMPVSSLPSSPPNQPVTTASVGIHRVPRQESSTDDYLAQLERLVLELNMELGRRRDDPQNADPMQQLSQRIIELNLENLALKEQLQRSSNPT